MSSHSKPPFPVFIAASVVIFLAALSAASSIGFVPYYLDESDPRNHREEEVALDTLPELGEEVFNTPAPIEEEQQLIGVLPDRIIISSIGLDLRVSNPDTRDIEELDKVLKDGPARYVDSARLGEKGNVLIFGHSSHLPVVHNAMYKAFNRIPELENGDVIAVQGGGKEFVYRVTGIKQVDASEGIIDLGRDTTKLTIVTCDTLTSKSSRFVLEAEFIGAYEI